MGAVLSWEDEDYRRLCYLTWSTWGKVAGVRVEEVDFGIFSIFCYDVGGGPIFCRFYNFFAFCLQSTTKI